MCEVNASSIISGRCNYLGYGSCYSTIVGGSYNSLYDSSIYSSIIGGCCNTVKGNSISSGIFGGSYNTVKGCDNSIISGCCNRISYAYQSSIIGGHCNQISNYLESPLNSVIVGGSNMTLCVDNTVLLPSIATNYDGSNFYGISTCNLTVGSNTMCIRNGIIVGIS